MKKNIFFLVLVFLLSGCANNRKEISNEKNNNELMDAFSTENSLFTQSSGAIGFGFLDQEADEYAYNGKDVVIRYYMENLGEANEDIAETGLLLFVDGESQPYKINLNGKESTTETMQKFKLQPGERLEFEIIFTPVSGKKGDKVGIIPAVIWSPNFMPENGEIARFGNCYRLNTNIPLTINMEQDGLNETKNSSTGYNIVDIPQSVLNQYEGVEGMDTYDILDSSVGFEIELPDDKNKLLIKDDKLEVTLNLYGGKQVTDKITLFIDNQPVRIDEGDFVEVKTQKGKMCQIKATIDASSINKNSVLYGVAMTSGNDYTVQDIYITNPVLLCREK